MRCVTSFLSILFSLLLSGAVGATTLTTSGAANNGNEGLMFDLQVGARDVTITALTSAGNSAVGLLYSVYARDGGFEGGQGVAAAWSLVATLLPDVSITTGELLFDIGDLELRAGSRTGIYLTAMEDRTPSEISYQLTTAGNVTAADEYLTILAGEGVNGIFGTTNSARQLVGSVSYELAVLAPIVSLPASGTMLLSLLGLIGVIRAWGILRRRWFHHRLSRRNHSAHARYSHAHPG